MKTVDGFFERLSTALNWLPGEVVGIILIIVAAGIAVGLHALAVRLIRPMLGRGNGYWRTLLIRTRGPTRLAFLIILISAAVKAAPFRATDEAILTQMLGVAFICLVGWTILRALQISSELHLRRYKLDVDDNLAARKHVTQIRILLRAASVLIFILTAAAVMMSFESVRQYGVSLLAAGGAAGIVVGLAAQPVLSNLLAGIQIAITQPVRIEDAVVVEGEWGWVEEITMTYAVVRLWDWRRLVLPIKYFIEQPFQNWTRETGAIIGSVMIYLDYTAPVAAIRAKAEEFARASPLWDRRVVNVQVSDARAETIELRILVSANTSPRTWDLRCEVREKVIDWLQREHPGCLPRQRMELTGGPAGDEAPWRRVRANASRSEPAEPVPAE
ncbi:mechanosensitive ion channel [Jiella endophytica]|uniref:Mechanosensitive ion channel n=1 Tax=Jiella endophytica TaxID=2558362 RepID=A0A4Y8RFY6_9HYPH|nr:mechanosensitive ion channel domain-containing protein [Jiella endophytica]TFF21652.1 mechanosensitive ion channel [Jiella endophytica]